MLKLLLLKVMLFCEKFLNLLNILLCKERNLKEKSFYFVRKSEKIRFIFRKFYIFNIFFFFDTFLLLIN